MKIGTKSISSALLLMSAAHVAVSAEISFPVVDTGQIRCYSNTQECVYPNPQEPFNGQDAQFSGLTFAFKENKNGTVSDLNTGLMWQQIPSSKSLSWDDAVKYCNNLKLGGHNDWRIPSLKELFSLSNFSNGWPYIDLTYFSLASQQLTLDEQYWCAELYSARNKKSAFAINQITGHIKASSTQGEKHVRAVRGSIYGINQFVDNQDGTVTDQATELMWMKADAGISLDWESALTFAEQNSCAGYSDWRLPNVKELQSIVDYSGVFPAINPLFSCTPITTASGQEEYGYYWTSTSAKFSSFDPAYYYAWYVAFGHAVNKMGLDADGAGAVRLDTKNESGPKGESGGRIMNQVRLVRDGNVTPTTTGPTLNEVKPITAAKLTRYEVSSGSKQQGGPGGSKGGSGGGGGGGGGGQQMQSGGQQSESSGPKDASGAAFIKRLDKDSDNKVSTEEFDGPADHFTQFDTNKDGYLTEDEAPQSGQNKR